MWRGVYDFALTSWNDENISVNEAHGIFRHRYFAPEAGDSAYAFQDLMEQAMPFWETAFISEGDRENYHQNFKLIDLPSKKQPGQWSRNYKLKVTDARKAIAQNKVISERLDGLEKIARRNFYTLSVFEQINELSIYPAKLLLLLEKYDLTDVKKKTEMAAEISRHIDSFDALRQQFESVYGETRIPGNPPDYRLDSNFHHHLANGTKNTDWMFMYELPMNRKVKGWLSQQSAANK